MSPKEAFALLLLLAVVGVVTIVAVTLRRDAAATRRNREEYVARLAAQAESARQAVAAHAEHVRRMEAAQAEAARAARWRELLGRFGEETATRILTGRVWQGATAAMVVATLGRPGEIDEHVMKTKRKHTYKYGWISGDRYRFRVFLEDEICVGWEG